jgi:hypothetical protein
VTVSQALAEIYASPGDEIVIWAVELTHPALAEPVRVVHNSEEDLTLPLAAGVGAPTALHVACAFDVTLSGFDEDGPTDAKLRIDNVSQLLFDPLEAAQGSNQPVTVVLRSYIFDPPTMTPQLAEVITGLYLKSVEVTATTAEGTLYREDGRGLNFPSGPRAFFDLQRYPGIHLG